MGNQITNKLDVNCNQHLLITAPLIEGEPPNLYLYTEIREVGRQQRCNKIRSKDPLTGQMTVTDILGLRTNTKLPVEEATIPLGVRVVQH